MRGRPRRASGRVGRLAAALAASVLVAAAPAAAQGVALPPDLGPPVRVGVAFGAGALPAATVTAVADPDQAPPAGAPPASLSVYLVGASSVALAQADAAVAATAAQTTPPWVGAAAGLWAMAFGPAPLAVLAHGLSPSAASSLAAATPGAVAVGLGPDGESVVEAGGHAPPASALLLTATGARVGPFADAAAADAAVATLGAAGLWAVADLAGSAVGAAAWSVRVMAPAGPGSRPAIAQATAAAATAALAGRGTPPPVVPIVASGSDILVAADGALTIAPAVWAVGAPGAVALAAPGGPPVPYAGALALLRPSPGSGLCAVNDVPLERYVAGVVPEEMSPGWPAAALEAQAIACRTYALFTAAGASPSAPFQLTDTASDQVYGGLGVQTRATDAATWATAGVVATYGGEPIDAMYEPDSGGATANSVDVWGNALPYLAAVREPKGYVPSRWRVARTPAQLARDAAAAGTATGDVYAVAPVRREHVSDRVIGLALTGPQGTATLVDDAVRTALGLPSDLFHLRSDTEVSVEGAGTARRVLGLVGLAVQGRSATAASVPPGAADRILGGAGAHVTVATSPSVYWFDGTGSGPGLGLTQDGARLLAQDGASASAIVLYYYRGVALTQWYGEAGA